MELSKMVIKMPFDILGRNAHRLVYKLQEVQSSIRFMIDGRSIDAKSLLGLLSAQIKEGDEIEVVCYNDISQFAANDLCTTVMLIREVAVMDDGV